MSDEHLTLPKQFDHAEAEARLYAAWEEAGCFKPSGIGQPYCVVIPPPNVTGSLHMGHALNNTLQDILVRFNRMRGKNVLWQVGTDHAGIATQMVVERQMAERDEPGRREIGRDAFVQKVWDWKAESAGTIQQQLRRLGASCDWSRERFTMDEGLSAAVRKVFVQLYNDGLIYRDKRLVNWDPKFLTAISDLEVETKDINGHMWYFDYPLADGLTYRHLEKDMDGNVVVDEERGFITVATTRPETMLGDSGVAVHPGDERYQDLVAKGAKVLLPLVGREIPLVVDEYADPEQGTGAVKITPAHDFNDFEVGVRTGLEKITILTFEAKIIHAEFVPEAFRGLDRFDARKAIVAAMDGLGLLRGVEEKQIQQPFGDRSGVVIEPMLTDQWYVDAKTMTQPALKAVEDGRTRFVPESWKKTYDNWLRDIQPWCISRQLWWGHQIPVWYGPDKDGKVKEDVLPPAIFVGEGEEDVIAAAQSYYGDQAKIAFGHQRDAALVKGPNGYEVVVLERDPDVLDTWFSSALWPFSTLGWPENTDEVAKFYPTSTLSTAFDIIFFWVARMMMMGLHFMKDENGNGIVPFKDVYIHAIVRDEHGAKMSKSKGNVIDPLVKMDEFGTDSLRFTLAAMAAPGRDVKLTDTRIEGYRNFRTKLWNAARFTQMNECKVVPGFDPSSVTTPLSQWIVHEAVEAEKTVTAGIEAYRFNDAAMAIYQFTWNIYCDWFLEFAKPVFFGDDEAVKAETRATGAWALDRILTLLHPFMPFVTEELWGKLADRDQFAMNASWHGPDISFPKAAADIGFVIDLVSEIRSVRKETNVPAGAKLPLAAVAADDAAQARLDLFAPLIARMARIDGISVVPEAPKGAAQIVVHGGTYALPIGDFIDLSAEVARLEKEIGKVTGEITKIDGKLGNERFMTKAPADVVAEQHTRKADFLTTLEKLQTALARLNSL